MSGIASKYAAWQEFMSLPFCLLYGAVVFILFFLCSVLAADHQKASADHSLCQQGSDSCVGNCMGDVVF